MSTLISALPHVFLPLTIIIAITSVTGFLGNAMAFHVFYFRFTSTGFNKLMATLAVYDMMACVIHMPLDIATFFPVGAARSYLCKITCFLLAFTSTGSALVLLAIAVVRFYGIHKPFLGTFSNKSAIYVVVVSLLIAAGVGLPITFLFGDGELKMESNVTAAICAVESRFSNSDGPFSYYLVLAGLYGLTLFFHTFLYVKSVITVWNRRRMFTSVKGNKNAIAMTPKIDKRHIKTSTTAGSKEDSINTNRHIPVSRNYQGKQRTQGDLNSSDRFGHSSNQENSTRPFNIANIPSSNSSNKPELNRERKNKNDGKKYRTSQDPPSQMTSYSNAGTLPIRGGKRPSNHVNQTSYRVLVVVIAISAAFFLSYAPHFAVMFYLFTHDNEVFTESAQSLAFELLMRSFFLNTVLDPIIYGLLSSDFRREARQSLKKLFC